MDNGHARPTAPLLRCAVILCCVAAWMALGWLWGLDTNQYLLLGVPITLLFQLFVRRLPIRALWVREAPPFRLDWKGIVIAVGFTLLPLSESSAALGNRDWTGAAYGVCGMAGAVAAAYSLRHLHRESLRPLVL